MITRVDSFFDCLGVDMESCQLGKLRAAQAGNKANSMTHQRDYEALAAVILHKRPKLVFEIGTYLGVTSDFFLEMLPESRVVSIAYPHSPWNIFKRHFNNTELTRMEIGSLVAPARRSRFCQLYGNSHKLEPKTLTEKYGLFDLVFIDGDHSRDGVFQDTQLAKRIIGDAGVICWHDANPKPKYLETRKFLEEELPLNAIATQDDYVGGIACWSNDIERKIAQGSKISQPPPH